MANEKQLSLLIKETSKAKQGGKLVRWTIIAKVLNAKGPNIESGYWWKQRYYNYLAYLRKKGQKGLKLTKFEKKIIIPAKKEKTKNVSENQLSLLMAAIIKAKQNNKKVKWTELAKIVNAGGAAIKSKSAWKTYIYQYILSLRKKMQKGVPLTQKEKQTAAFYKKKKNRVPSKKQLLLLLDNKKKAKKTGKKFFWVDVAELLNAEGPCIKTPKTWSVWYGSYAARLRKKIRNKANLTELEKKFSVFAV